MKQRKSRIFDHVVINVKDINQSKKFYRAVVETLGHTITGEAKDQFFIDELNIRENPEVSSGCVHIAFYAESPGSVKLFHETALRCGGKCIGAPDERSFSGVYASNIIDPDGNHIEAIYKSRNQRSFPISY